MIITTHCSYCGPGQIAPHICPRMLIDSPPESVWRADIARLTSELAAANQQIDAMRAELDEANERAESFRENDHAKEVAMRDMVGEARAWMRSVVSKTDRCAIQGAIDKAAKVLAEGGPCTDCSELAALRQSTEADAEPVAWLVRVPHDRWVTFEKPDFGGAESAYKPLYLRPAPVAPEPAPSRSARTACSFCQVDEPRILNGDSSASVCGGCAGMHWDICRPDDPSPVARAEEPVGYAVRYPGGSHGPMFYATRDAAQAAGGFNEVVPLYTAPPAQAAEIARLMMEKERKQHVIEERDAEIAKLKAEVERLRKVVMTMPFERARELVGEWWEDHNGATHTKPDSCDVDGKLVRVRRYRLVREPASGGGK